MPVRYFAGFANVVGIFMVEIQPDRYQQSP